MFDNYINDKAAARELRRHDPLCKMADGCAGAIVGPIAFIIVVVLLIGAGIGWLIAHHAH
jgi:type IV secretory pathway VirB2 component (pilin)